LSAKHYKEEQTCPSDEKNPTLDYDPSFEEENADAKSFEYPADVIKKESLPDLIRENMDLMKYYKKRHSIFSKYEEGIQLDKGMYFIHFLIIDDNF